MSTYRSTPQLSVSKLAEYITARPAKRLSIIEDCCLTPVYFLDRYGICQKAIVESLMLQTLIPVERARHALVRKPVRNQSHAKRISDAIACLNAFTGGRSNVAVRGTGTVRLSNVSKSIEIGGVRVIVAPHFGLTRQSKSGSSTHGLVRLYTSKSNPLDEDRARLMCQLMHRYSEVHLNVLGVADAKLGVVMDVFADRFFEGYSSLRRMNAEIDAACSEIAARWPLVVQTLLAGDRRRTA